MLKEFFKNLSVSKKIRAVVLLVTVVALVIFCALLIAYDQRVSRATLLREVETSAKVIGENCASALIFSDRETAEKILAALRAEENITRAAVYETDGKLFASYARKKAIENISFPDRKNPGHSFEKGHLFVFDNIEFKDETVGTIFLQSNLDRLGARLRNFLIVIGGIFAGCLGLAIFLASRLQQGITGPIIYLKDQMRAVAASRDYSLRAKVDSRDEVGALADGFNKMLTEVQEKDMDLAESKSYVDNIIKSMIDTLIVVDPDGKIKTINKATSDLLGYKEDELIGKPVATIFAEEEEEEEEVSIFKGTRLKKLIEEGTMRDYDVKYQTKKGEVIPVSFSGAVMRDKKGELVGIVGIARDMREIKRLMEKEKELAAAAAAAETDRKRATELEKAYKELREKTEDLEKFHEITVGRELDMVKLKEKINSLLEKLGQPKEYEETEKIKNLEEEEI